jgi:hypothetical protein
MPRTCPECRPLFRFYYCTDKKCSNYEVPTLPVDHWLAGHNITAPELITFVHWAKADKQRNFCRAKWEYNGYLYQCTIHTGHKGIHVAHDLSYSEDGGPMAAWY